MRRIVIVLFLSINFLSQVCFANVINFGTWKKACLALPKHTKSFQPSPLTNKDFFVNTLAASIKLFEKNYAENHWIGDFKWQDDKPFAQKLLVCPESTVYFFGDLHGNIHDLLKLLSELAEQNIIDNNFKIIAPNTYLIFLGDYVDRGFYGVEVLYTILRLKLANLHNVFMVRGNHEDMDLNAHYGFLEELKTKFNNPAQPNLSYDLITHFYNHLPSVIYLGCKNGNHVDFIQCCHGGMEIGYNPSALLSSQHSNACESIMQYKRKEEIRALPAAIKQQILLTLPEKEVEDHIPYCPTQPVHNGFLWNDFIVDNNNLIVDYMSGRGWSFGQSLTEELLKKYSNSQYTVHAIFRAHQHYGAMLEKLEENNGIADLWDGMVYTFLSGKPSGINVSHTNCGVLKVSDQFKNWKLSSLISS